MMYISPPRFNIMDVKLQSVCGGGMLMVLGIKEAVYSYRKTFYRYRPGRVGSKMGPGVKGEEEMLKLLEMLSHD